MSEIRVFIADDESPARERMKELLADIAAEVPTRVVGDPAIDPLQPEALVYEPKANGGYRLVAVEWVRIGPEVADPPTVLGVEMRHVPSGNRYGIEPDGFYQRHLWLYDRNPAGLFADWNPTVSCRGTGDGGG